MDARHNDNDTLQLTLDLVLNINKSKNSASRGILRLSIESPPVRSSSGRYHPGLLRDSTKRKNIEYEFYIIIIYLFDSSDGTVAVPLIYLCDWTSIPEIHQGWIYWGGTGGMLPPHILGEVGVQGDWQFLPSPSLDLEKQLQKQKLSSLVSGCPIARYSEYV
jgi:hypothetical protein